MWSSKIPFSVTSARADTEARKNAAKTDNVFILLIPVIVQTNSSLELIASLTCKVTSSASVKSTR